MTEDWLGGPGFQTVAISQPIFPLPGEAIDGRVSGISIGDNYGVVDNSFVGIQEPRGLSSSSPL